MISMPIPRPSNPRHIVTDPLTEQLLDRFGVKWTLLPSVRLAQIDVDASKRLQEHFRPLDESQVVRYATFMEQGHEFPPLVAIVKGTYGAEMPTPYVLVAGNHRLAALLKVKRTYHAIYLIDTKDAVLIKRLAEAHNVQTNALGVSREVAIQLACQAVTSGTMNQADACRFYALDSGALSRQLLLEQSDQRLRNLGVDPLHSGLTTQARHDLHRLKTDDIFSLGVQFIRQQRLTSKLSEQLINELAKARSLKQAQAVLETWQQSPEIQAHRQRLAQGKRMPSGKESALKVHLASARKLAADAPLLQSLSLEVLQRQHELARETFALLARAVANRTI